MFQTVGRPVALKGSSEDMDVLIDEILRLQKAFSEDCDFLRKKQVQIHKKSEEKIRPLIIDIVGKLKDKGVLKKDFNPYGGANTGHGLYITNDGAVFVVGEDQ